MCVWKLEELQLLEFAAPSVLKISLLQVEVNSDISIFIVNSVKIGADYN
ncbi:hypothetical protein [Dulcicalothrix desertica]|nr:hypothetical protein [Dulcicalothrix desertica]